jgi:2-polyprenyl-3-methyl-5-hydroxy-6-metoxy-1,4-benzoquinol methylase
MDMPPIPLLTKLQLLEGNKTALDVGTKDGKIAQQLSTLGLEVDAIDIEKIPEHNPVINFEQTSLEDFLKKNTKHFDIVIARHVLPFTNDPLVLISKLNSIAGIFIFTCFGPQDEWSDRDSIVTLEK